jgi:hypothetical protein
MAKLLSGFLIAGAFAALLATTALGQSPDPCPAATCRPKFPGYGVQAGLTSAVSNVDRAETQIAHEATIVAPTASGSSYSYSIVAETDTHWVMRMGYIVLANEQGLARWFVRIYDDKGVEKQWSLSRAGAANPPPACSACSGDTTTQGYPFSFGLTQANTWTFWFDWITKLQYKNSAAGTKLIKVYFLGEANSSNIGMDPRKALTTYRLTLGQGSWFEPTSVTVYSSSAACNDTDGAQYADFDVQRTATDTQVRNDGKTYRSTTVGSLLSDGIGATVSPLCGPFTW